MAEKRFDTRILLKYDSLANWNSSELILKAGEVAIATVPAAEVESKENGIITPPAAVIIKVGDDKSTFAQLPIVSGLAADVYSWAKQDEGTFKTWLNETAGFATDAELIAVDTALRKLISQIEGGEEGGGLVEAYADIENLKTVLKSFLPEGESTAVEDAVKTAIDAVDAKIGVRSAEGASASGVYADIEALEESVEVLEGYVGTPASEGTEATGLHAKVEALEESLAGVVGEDGKSLAEQLSDMKESIAGTEEKIGEVPADTTLVDMISGLETEIDGITGEEGILASLESRVEANEDAIALLNEGSEVEGSVAHTVAVEVAKVVANAPTDFDTLKEVADWIANDTTGAAAMQTDIATLKTVVGVPSSGEGEEAIEATGLHAKIEEIESEIDSVSSGLDSLSDVVAGLTNEETGVLAGLDSRIAAIEEDYLTSEDKTELETAISAKADQTALEAEIERATEKENAIEKSVTDLDASLSTVAKTGKFADLLQGEEEIIFDCGNATGKTTSVEV